jgi:anti-anti-sigma factor
MSQFAIEERIHGRARTIAIQGEFVVEHVPAADSALTAAGADPARTLIVSLSECEFVDSAAIATLHAAFRRAQGGRGMEIVAPTGSEVRRRLERTGLDRVIPTFGSLPAALAPVTMTNGVATPTEIFEEWVHSDLAATDETVPPQDNPGRARGAGPRRRRGPTGPGAHPSRNGRPAHQ